jgi:uroporphyrinogen decarboxylase
LCVASQPYAEKVTAIIKERHPTVPVIFFANGGSSYLELQGDMGADMICVDWHVDMAQARRTLGLAKPVSGNVDPSVLLGPSEGIVRAVDQCITGAGVSDAGHILNLGHGVIKETPEEAVKLFVDTAKSIKLRPRTAAPAPGSASASRAPEARAADPLLVGAT